MQSIFIIFGLVFEIKVYQTCDNVRRDDKFKGLYKIQEWSNIAFVMIIILV